MDDVEYVSIDEVCGQEEARLLELLSKLDPKSEDYSKILVRWKSFASVRIQSNKTNAQFESDIEKLKHQKEQLEFDKEKFEKEMRLKDNELDIQSGLKERELETREEELKQRNKEWMEEVHQKRQELMIRRLELKQREKSEKAKDVLSGLTIGTTILLGMANLNTYLKGQERDIKFSETGTYLNAYGRHAGSTAQRLLDFKK